MVASGIKPQADLQRMSVRVCEGLAFAFVRFDYHEFQRSFSRKMLVFAHGGISDAGEKYVFAKLHARLPVFRDGQKSVSVFYLQGQ